YASVATLLDVALVGICTGFLLHNWHPAKLFMGDAGSMLLGYLITCASIMMTGRLDPSAVHASLYLPLFMPILLPILVLFLPVLDMVLAIVRRVSRGQSPMHPDRMHLHHRMLRIGHSVQSAVLILWAWAALISFSSVMTIFVRVRYVLIGAGIAAVLLTAATLAPYYKRKRHEGGSSGPDKAGDTAADGKLGHGGGRQLRRAGRGHRGSAVYGLHGRPDNNSGNGRHAGTGDIAHTAADESVPAAGARRYSYYGSDR
ncbi:MAG: undecaprenyl/decaprenyl-phosphate alpha-N-acetylglucosaminyl 1-phosphate transferase, partial [Scardovia wiggsiae]|nr:undecaprenyl/decaprenyl-phosphate alpha-N-acetylglucosaminyl 1-phosphate transferase [Scardovia wiggsiae]